MSRLRALLLVAGALAGLAAAAVAAADPAASFSAGLAAAAAADYPTALERLEAAVAAEPDNLRWGAEYRQVVIACGEYDRAIEFFQRLTEAHPEAANAHLNLGYAYVDKIPAAGAVTQVILANTALGHFSSALEREETWLGRYTRGNSYLYWPAIFGRTPKGIADLERAIELAGETAARPYQARAWAALGDGHWRLGEIERAREIWRQGRERFPGDPDLEARLSREGEALDAFLEQRFDTNARVETHLRELWQGGEPAPAGGPGAEGAAGGEAGGGGERADGSA